MARAVQNVPALRNSERPETGPMQFGEDWPGVFIRGDNALGFNLAVRHAASLLRDNPAAGLTFSHLEALASVLASCRA